MSNQSKIKAMSSYLYLNDYGNEGITNTKNKSKVFANRRQRHLEKGVDRKTKISYNKNIEVRK